MTTQRADLRGLVDTARALAKQRRDTKSIDDLGLLLVVEDLADALESALSAPGEPVAWMVRHPTNGVTRYYDSQSVAEHEAPLFDSVVVPLCLSPHAHAELTPAPVKVASELEVESCRRVGGTHDRPEFEVKFKEPSAPVPVPAAAREPVAIGGDEHFVHYATPDAKPAPHDEEREERPTMLGTPAPDTMPLAHQVLALLTTPTRRDINGERVFTAADQLAVADCLARSLRQQPVVGEGLKQRVFLAVVAANDLDHANYHDRMLAITDAAITAALQQESK